MGAFGVMISRYLAKVSGKTGQANATPLPGTGTSVEAVFLTLQRRLTNVARETFQAFTSRRVLTRIMYARSVVLAAASRVLTTRASVHVRARTTDACQFSDASTAVETIVPTPVFGALLPTK